MQLGPSRRDFDINYFSEVPNTKTATSITLKADTIPGFSDVTYQLITGCNGNDFKRAKTIQVLPNCTGTLDGGSLYSYNYVTAGTHNVKMHLNSWTWVKTSGNASGSTSGGGKNMTFTISSGCVSFNTYNASCNQYFTFCKSSWSSGYIIMDMKSLKVIKEGKVKDTAEINALLAELPEGDYVVNIEGNTTRYKKSN